MVVAYHHAIRVRCTTLKASGLQKDVELTVEFVTLKVRKYIVTGFVTILTQQVPLMEQELFTLPGGGIDFLLRISSAIIILFNHFYVWLL
jgi:hypothetical protein